MEKQKEFERMFTALRPIRHEHNEEGAGRKRRMEVFRIALKLGEPFLLLKSESNAITPSERRLKAELTRIAEFSSAGLFEEKDSEGIYASIWENPHLLSFITPDCRVEGPQGGRLAFSDDQAYAVLSIKETEQDSLARPELLIMAEDQELTDATFLDDTHVLCGDTVFILKSVGDNYRSICRLVTPIDKHLLESFLTLFLTYVTNITPEINGIRPRYSSHTEHAQPTLFLEKVAPDKALYLRVGSTVESLSGTLPPGVTPTAAVSIDEDRRIRIRKVEDCDIEGKAARLEELITQSAPNRNAKKEIYRDGYFFIVPEETAGPFLIRQLPQVLEDFRLVGSDKLKEYKVVAVTPKVNFKFSSGIDFLEGEGDVEIAGESFSIADILKQYAQKRYVELSDGNRGIYDEK